ncbi:MAG TPA: histidine kinase [Steroidobacteraceae bacterium]|jgi:two-component system sensor histidine kinase DesK
MEALTTQAMDRRTPLGHQGWAAIFSLAGCVLLIDPMRRGAGATQWALSAAGAVAFTGLFLATLVDWRRGRSGLWQSVSITLIGAACAPSHSVSWVFFVVPCAFAAWIAGGDIWRVASIVCGVMGLALIEKLTLSLPWAFFGAVAGYGIPTAVMTTLTLRRAIAVRELARHGERERIARDMHDVLGHTLSLIILKADLSARLAHKDPDRAVKELGEIDRIARATLDEMRQALKGYRAKSLEQEFELARHTLMMAGVGVNTQFQPPRLDPAQENVLCLALREGVTNVVRHARAKHCRLAVGADQRDCLLEIEDDGEAGESRRAHPEGGGLAGMRERVAEIGGSITQLVERGTKLIVRLPL